MEENKSCYQFQQRIYENVLFQHVDATYILHLKDNGRLPHIEDQLVHYPPTRIVYLVENQGYKTCPKTLPKHIPPYDLTDAFLQAFRHASLHHYQHILILEDDFTFTTSPTLPESCKDIDAFIQPLSSSFMYSLGCIPFLQSVGSNHNRLYLSGGMHACIYSKPLRNHILDYPQSDIVDWDTFSNMKLASISKYVYYKPLCYQLFPNTENSKHWEIGSIVKFIFSMTGVDKQVEPGYSIHYAISKLLYIGLCLFMVYVILWIYKKRKYVQGILTFK